jgi:hypothetical protein
VTSPRPQANASEATIAATIPAPMTPAPNIALHIAVPRNGVRAWAEVLARVEKRA